VADFVVAIDGPAGSGKSSVSKAVAQRLGFGYLDTGAGYRAYALWARKIGTTNFVANFPYEISLDPSNPLVTLEGEDVTELIRTAEVASAVSEFAQLDQVRLLQRDDARARIADCKLPGIVVEGRDITTVVAPDAQVRILLTASESVRLQRRGLEQTESGANLLERDRRDSKVAQFLSAPDGVRVVDTTELDFEQSVAAVLAEITKVRDE
jgi:CMP/dCMP kinase